MSLLKDNPSQKVVTTTTYTIPKEDLIKKIKSEITETGVSVEVKFIINEGYHDYDRPEFEGITVTVTKYS